MPKSCIIVGNGIAGSVAALALSRIGIQCTIYELRDSPATIGGAVNLTPATIGGAVNLTPNALKLFKELRVEVPGCVCHAIEIFSYMTGSKLVDLPFEGPGGPSLRNMRERLLKGLLDAVERAGVKVVYGSKLVSIADQDNGDMVAVFENDTSAKANFIVGCDGMYSRTRMTYVESERIPIFTGAASAYTVVEVKDIKSPIHFKQTAVNSGVYGSIVTTYIDPDKTLIHLVATMRTEERKSKEGWKARGLDHEQIMKEIDRRFSKSALPCLPELLGRATEYTYYPVYKLGPGGKWCRGKVILLGDAAHGMPPQGESCGLAIEDAVLLACVFKKLPIKSVSEVFKAYEKTRRTRIDAAYKSAVFQWMRMKDKGWIAQKLEEWSTWAYMWWKSDFFIKSFYYDVTKEDILE